MQSDISLVITVGRAYKRPVSITNDYILNDQLSHGCMPAWYIVPSGLHYYSHAEFIMKGNKVMQYLYLDAQSIIM